MNKWIDVLIYGLVTGAIYFGSLNVVNPPKSKHLVTKVFTSIVGWLMLTALLLCLGIFVFGRYDQLPNLAQEFVASCVAGIALSVNGNSKDWQPPLPYKLAKWFTIAGLVWAIGGLLHLY